MSHNLQYKPCRIRYRIDIRLVKSQIGAFNKGAKDIYDVPQVSV